MDLEAGVRRERSQHRAQEVLLSAITVRSADGNIDDNNGKSCDGEARGAYVELACMASFAGVAVVAGRVCGRLLVV